MVENLQREDLNALEKAVAFRDYLEQLRRHAGGTRKPPRPRSLHHLEPDPTPRPSRRGSGRGPATRRSPQGHARAILGLPDADSQIGAYQRNITENPLGALKPEALVATGEPPTPAHPDPQGLTGRARRSASGRGNKTPHVLRRLEKCTSTTDSGPGPDPGQEPRPRPDRHRLQLKKSLNALPV